ncbi:MAG TPA: pyruvate kinase [Pyrinomonadaceae bacterium]|nr:pyruvate kinase [Pyrinomonadaceae bacterium]
MSTKPSAKTDRDTTSERELENLIQGLSEIRDDMQALGSRAAEKLLALKGRQRESARNLVHYMALRRRDLRRLQESLAALGLSSLGRAEAHVMDNVDTTLFVLRALADKREASKPEFAVGFAEGNGLLKEHTTALLGPERDNRNVRIMVTMPSEAAEDSKLINDLVTSGMDCMRINCAYDDQEAWGRMIANLRLATKRTGKTCRVLMDLAGPKLRTGPMEAGAKVIRWRPIRNQFGRIKYTARIWLTSDGENACARMEADACLRVPEDWLQALEPGDLIKFFDARGASRSMRVMKERSGRGRWAESSQTAYISPGMTLHAYRHSRKRDDFSVSKDCTVAEFPASEQWIDLRAGDELILTRSLAPGRAAVYTEDGRLLSAARIGVTLPEIFEDVRVGERILLDDGKIGGVIESVDEEEIHVQITHTRPGGGKLRADKGINLPDTNLRLPSLTDKDLEDLAFIARHADLVGYSFVRSAEDVRLLQAHLKELGGHHLGIVLKIETGRAFEELPNLLLAAMRSPSAGVMIARGDLAVECGYERMAEVQEEILWICEAAHVPVIWATQVLESLAKAGLPSRAEITDAAMGERAECVMLNKGPFIVEAVKVLDDILHRMQEHQVKKRSMLRSLKLAQQFELEEETCVAHN